MQKQWNNYKRDVRKQLKSVHCYVTPGGACDHLALWTMPSSKQFHHHHHHHHHHRHHHHALEGDAKVDVSYDDDSHGFSSCPMLSTSTDKDLRLTVSAKLFRPCNLIFRNRETAMLSKVQQKANNHWCNPGQHYLSSSWSVWQKKTFDFEERDFQFYCRFDTNKSIRIFVIYQLFPKH